MRELVRIVSITNVRPIPDADAIEVAFVGGWPVVVPKGEYEKGSKAVFFEIDAFLPEGNPHWQFLIDIISREYNGQKGHVLKTVRKRKQVSQGLLLPFGPFSELLVDVPFGVDVSDKLGVVKFEAPTPEVEFGLARCVKPSMIPTTDEERVQNIPDEVKQWADEEVQWETTEKLEGYSFTAAKLEDGIHICSRGVSYLETPGNIFWQVANRLQLVQKIEAMFPDRYLAFQGELVGPGVEGNIYKLTQHRVYLYKVYDVMTGFYFSDEERNRVAEMMGMLHVPFLGFVTLPKENTVDAILAMADGVSVIANVPREGVVFKSRDGRESFKAVSNKYLLKQK